MQAKDAQTRKYGEKMHITKCILARIIKVNSIITTFTKTEKWCLNFKNEQEAETIVD